jgi:hypothetical protein
MDLKRNLFGFVYWIHPAHVDDWWRALLKTIMNLRVAWKVGNFLTS